MSDIRSSLRKVEAALAATSAMLVVVVACLICATILLRVTLRVGIPGYYELTEMLTVPIVLLPLAYVQSRGRHIVLSMVTDRLRPYPRAEKLVTRFCLLISLFCCIIICWLGLQLTWEAWREGAYAPGQVKWPMWPVKATIPLSAFLASITTLIQMIAGPVTLEGDRSEVPSES